MAKAKDITASIKWKDIEKKVNFDSGTSLEEIYEKVFGEDTLKTVVAATVDGKLRELNYKVNTDVDITFIALNSSLGIDLYKRSIVLLMMSAIKNVIKKEDGQYRIKLMYSFGNTFHFKMDDCGVEINEEFLSRVENEMARLVEKDIRIEKKVYSTREMIQRYYDRNLPAKAELLRYRRASKINIYNIDGYEDYYYGFMVPSTGYLDRFQLKPLEEGFVLTIPEVEGKTPRVEYKASEMIGSVLKQAEDWGSMMNINNIGALNNLIVAGHIDALILVQEALMEKQIADIAAKIAEEKRQIILIAGPSSSGKTTFSNRLSVQLAAHGLFPHPVAMDDFFKERVDTPKDADGNYDFECIGAMDLDLFNKTMSGLLEGRTMEMPRFNFAKGKKEWDGTTMTLKQSDVLVVEGIHALNPLSTISLPKDSSFKIYVSALSQLSLDEHNRISTTDIRLLRRIVRDARTRGNSAEKTLSMWPSVRRGEIENIYPYQGLADAVFNSAMVYELPAIKIYAEPLLFGVEETSPENYEARRLLKFLNYFLGIDVQNVPSNSLIREFIGGSLFRV